MKPFDPHNNELYNTAKEIGRTMSDYYANDITKNKLEQKLTTLTKKAVELDRLNDAYETMLNLMLSAIICTKEVIIDGHFGGLREGYKRKGHKNNREKE